MTKERVDGKGAQLDMKEHSNALDLMLADMETAVQEYCSFLVDRLEDPSETLNEKATGGWALVQVIQQAGGDKVKGS